MKGVNHGEEGSRPVIQVYYPRNLGKDNQARPCFSPPTSYPPPPPGVVLGWLEGTTHGKRGCIVLWVLFLF